MGKSDYYVGQVANLVTGDQKSSTKNKKLAALFDVNKTNKKKEKQPSNGKNKSADSTNKRNSNQKKHAKLTSKNADDKTKLSHLEEQNKEVKCKKKKKRKKKPVGGMLAVKTESPSASEEEKNQQGDSSSPRKHSKGYCPPEGIVHEALMGKSKNDKDEKKSRKRKKSDEDDDDDDNDGSTQTRKRRRRDKEKERRTIYVGNLPLDTNKVAVKKMFAECGKIASVRYRCPPVADPKVPKKVTVIKQEFHPSRSNIVAFVCFEEQESAKAALKFNGHDLHGFHLRVDLSLNSKKHDKKKSVFVGNLLYSIEENALWDHFEPCGKIENVRLVRDRKTGLGKGFGYVLFEDEGSVDLALKLDKSKLAGRALRVTKCTDSKPSEKFKYKTNPAKQRILKKQRKLAMKPTNLRPGETRKPKVIKKKQKSRHKDPVDKVFASVPDGPKKNKHVKFE